MSIVSGTSNGAATSEYVSSQESENIYEVEDIVDYRVNDESGVTEYRVRWKFWQPEWDTWEPEENLITCQDMIEKFRKAKGLDSTAHAVDVPSSSRLDTAGVSGLETETESFSESNSSVPPVKDIRPVVMKTEQQVEEFDEETMIIPPAPLSPPVSGTSKQKQRKSAAPRRGRGGRGRAAKTTTTPRKLAQEPDTESGNLGREDQMNASIDAVLQSSTTETEQSDDGESSASSAGRLKDRFWKDLEMGRVQINTDESLYTSVGRRTRAKSSMNEADMFRAVITGEPVAEPPSKAIRGRGGRGVARGRKQTSNEETAPSTRSRGRKPKAVESAQEPETPAAPDVPVDEPLRAQNLFDTEAGTSDGQYTLEGNEFKFVPLKMDETAVHASGALQNKEVPDDDFVDVKFTYEDAGDALTSGTLRLNLDNEPPLATREEDFMDFVTAAYNRDQVPVLASFPEPITHSTDEPSSPTQRDRARVNSTDAVQDSEKTTTRAEERVDKYKARRHLMEKEFSKEIGMRIERDFDVAAYRIKEMKSFQSEQLDRLYTPAQFKAFCLAFDSERVRLIAKKNPHPLYVEQPDHEAHELDDIMEILVQAKANLNHANLLGNTALHLAADRGDICKVSKLISLGAYLNLQNRVGETPLTIACLKGNAHAAVRLLEHGADFSVVNSNGVSLMDITKQSKQQVCIDILQGHINKVKALFDQEVQVVLARSARLKKALLPFIRCLALNENSVISIPVQFEPFQFVTDGSCGFLLFIALAKFTQQQFAARLHGTCPIERVTLNGKELVSVQDSGNFVFPFLPKSGNNEFVISCVDKAKASYSKLLVQAFFVSAKMDHFGDASVAASLNLPRTPRI